MEQISVLPACSEDRLAVLSRIRENERTGGEAFFLDVEPDPPSRPILPEEVDYLEEKNTTKLKHFVAGCLEALGQLYFTHYYRMEFTGLENLSGISGGAIITSNHFGKFENLAVKNVADRAPGEHRFYKVVREGNFFIPGFLGFMLKNCNTLPLSSNVRTMMKLDHAIETILRRGDFILIYPEQSMWWNYRKPRPYRAGAFRYAAKNGVPVVPCFITLQDQKRTDADGFPIQKYTVHILPPVYPDPQKTLKENTAEMREKNFSLCKAVYEAVYKKPLSYSCSK